MTDDALEHGARAIEEEVGRLAREAGVVLVTTHWNGEEGLHPEASTQVLMLTGTARVEEAVLRTDAIIAAADSGPDAAAAAAVRGAVEQLRHSEPHGDVPTGGGG
ncbi:hypothetical protein [Sediminicurvatus halobius]|uniref:Uncharacterized protein n=1 Tax=Sediminicurvatus halobius TaxID=2182432 RepID=A0A2U2MX41_9GAMM|nr:hypothetical protein [Spiribacter halobius]PWG61435.1 hypothetical protein DEM34_16530 [Spiribacter halobius]UEX76941.1 hypothetical protein LMH63_13395 [Spiribacter halobius]